MSADESVGKARRKKVVGKDKTPLRDKVVALYKELEGGEGIRKNLEALGIGDEWVRSEDCSLCPIQQFLEMKGIGHKDVRVGVYQTHLSGPAIEHSKDMLSFISEVDMKRGITQKPYENY